MKSDFVRGMYASFFCIALAAVLFPLPALAVADEGAPAILPSPTLPKLSLKKIQWAHFSSTTGKAICRVNVGKVLPASKRTGPFIIPAPGYELRQVVIDIIPGNCAEKDLTALANILADLRHFTLREAIVVRLLDESGNDSGSLWRVDGLPSLRASPAEPGQRMILFLSRDIANRPAPLLLYRDSPSGTLVLQSPPPRPSPFGVAQ